MLKHKILSNWKAQIHTCYKKLLISYNLHLINVVDKNKPHETCLPNSIITRYCHCSIFNDATLFYTFSLFCLGCDCQLLCIFYFDIMMQYFNDLFSLISLFFSNSFFVIYLLSNAESVTFKHLYFMHLQIF